MRMALRFGEPVRHLPNGAAKLFHVEKMRSPKSRRESVGTVRDAGGLNEEAAMSRWTDEELRELATLWPTHSVSELVEHVAPPALGDTQQGKTAAPGWTAAAQSFRGCRSKPAKAAVGLANGTHGAGRPKKGVGAGQGI